MKDLKKFNFSISDTTTWAGSDTVGFYSTALLGFDTAKYLELVPNVKSKVKLASYNIGTIVQADNVSWNPTGEGTLAQKTVTVCPLKVNWELFKTTFEQDYMSQYMRSGSNTEEVTPDTFKTYIVEQTMKKIANDLETLTWGAASAGTATCDGLITKFSADNATVKVTYSAVTSSNVLSVLTAIYNKIPTALLKDKENVKFYVAANVARAYSLFQTQTGAGAGFNYGSTEALRMNFLGYEVVVCPGMDDSTIVAASQKNLVLTTDLTGDYDDEGSILVIPQIGVSGIPSLRVRAGWKFGVDFKVSAEVVWMHS